MKQNILKTENNLPGNWNQLATVSCGKILHVLATATATVSTLKSYRPNKFLPEDLAIRDM